MDSRIKLDVHIFSDSTGQKGNEKLFFVPLVVQSVNAGSKSLMSTVCSFVHL